ncbi:MAG: alpha/beta hydrolase [Gemmataceae bacterium]|nr:alpha/beta hydrolase [Gemmataceae bacterium]
MKFARLLVLVVVVGIASALSAEPGDAPAAVRVAKNVTYATVGGEDLKLDLAIPPGPGPHPAVVLFHGGAWRYGSRADLSRRLVGDDGKAGPSLLELVAARGYVAASVGYRLAPKHKFPAQLDDARAAVRFLRRNATTYHIDPDRIGAGGFSAGGHIALLLGLADPDDPPGGPSSRPGAVASFFGPADLSRYAATPGIEACYMVPWLGPDCRTDAEVYRRASPICHASADDPPVLLVHGTADLIVPVLHSELLLDKLRAAGVTAELLTVKGGGHGWAGPDLTRTTAAALDFLDEHLKGKK